MPTPTVGVAASAGVDVSDTGGRRLQMIDPKTVEIKQSIYRKGDSLSWADDVRPFVAIVACIAGKNGVDRFIEEHLLSSV